MLGCSVVWKDGGVQSLVGYSTGLYMPAAQKMVQRQVLFSPAVANGYLCTLDNYVVFACVA